MPRVPGLLRLPNGRYALNIAIPKELRGAFGRKDTIRKSLGTSDWRTAVSRLRFEAHKVELAFDEKRRALQRHAEAIEDRRKISDLSEQEMHGLVARWFIDLERRHQAWWDERGRALDDELDLPALLDDLRVDEAAYMGGTKSIAATDCKDSAAMLLKEEGIEPEDGPALNRVGGMLQRAMLECLRRSMDRVTRKLPKARDPYFEKLHAHTAPPTPQRRTTLGELLKRHAQQLSDSDRTKGTRTTYTVPYRLLREAFGDRKPLEEIRSEDIEELYRLLRRVPVNASKRYPGMTIHRAAKEADRRNDPMRLSGATLDNYYNNISAIFTFAVTKELMAKNPAKDKYMRAMLHTDTGSNSKALFAPEELNRLFRAPLYVGCKDDASGYHRPGDFHGRRGRFWVPLIALFHGFRCNEAVQLYTEDIEHQDGVDFFFIRAERADGSKCDKVLKTPQSKRRVPIHPELIRLGFLKFVEERRRESCDPRLFPEMEVGHDGYFSDPFSKWFGRFKKSVLGPDCKATFHSFRHMFRDALSEAGVSTRDAERLGGWYAGTRSAEADYSKGPSLRYLQRQIEKVKFEGLDLSHLNAEFCNPLQAQSLRRQRVKKRRMRRSTKP